MAEPGDGGLDIVSAQLTRHRGLLRARWSEHVLLGRDRRRAHGLAVVRGIVRVRHPADVHQLDEQGSAACMHRVGDPSPSLDVFGSVDAGGVQVALAVLGRLCALGDDQPE